MRGTWIAVSTLAWVLTSGCGPSTGEPESLEEEHGAGGSGEVSGAAVLEPQYGSPRLEVDAKGGGEDVEGTFSIGYPGLEGQPSGQLSGRVICMYVNANQAYLLGQVEQLGVQDPLKRWQVGDFVIIGVFDLGDAAAPGAQPDRANFSPGFATKPTCGLNPTAAPDFGVVEGDYSVKPR